MIGRALVLNASFEPLSVVASRRALVLVLADKAVLVHGTGHDLHSARARFPEPSIVRLVNYVRVPHQARVAVTRRRCSSVMVTVASTAARRRRTSITSFRGVGAGRTVGTTSWRVAGAATAAKRTGCPTRRASGSRGCRERLAPACGCSPQVVRSVTNGLPTSSPCSAAPSASEHASRFRPPSGLARPGTPRQACGPPRQPARSARRTSCLRLRLSRSGRRHRERATSVRLRR